MSVEAIVTVISPTLSDTYYIKDIFNAKDDISVRVSYDGTSTDYFLYLNDWRCARQHTMFTSEDILSLYLYSIKNNITFEQMSNVPVHKLQGCER